MAALAPEWNDLAAPAPCYFLSQTFAWWNTALAYAYAAPRGAARSSA